MGKIKLYNMAKIRSEGVHFANGEEFRVDTIYRCTICHTKTNRWIMGGWPGYGARILCPGDLYQEHNKLEAALSVYDSSEIKIGDYEKVLENGVFLNRAQLKIVIDNLYGERTLLEAMIKNLRGLFSGLDNVEGLDENVKVEDYKPSSRYTGKKKSLGE